MADLRAEGISTTPEIFDQIIGIQGTLEQQSFRPYRDIVALSLSQVLGMPNAKAQEIGRRAGKFPLYEDSETALRKLMKKVPCIAMTNSDFAHGEQVQSQLGFRLTDWVCAEEVKVYKPSESFWRIVSERRNVPLRRDWWHVAAYADYDLKVAKQLGLTTVFISRPHNHSGPADYTFADLNTFADAIANQL